MDEQLGEERRVKNGMEGVVYGHMRMGMHLPTGLMCIALSHCAGDLSDLLPLYF